MGCSVVVQSVAAAVAVSVAVALAVCLHDVPVLPSNPSSAVQPPFSGKKNDFS